ncbi:MAG: shikimate kinase [Saprospiraceae bacterium]
MRLFLIGFMGSGKSHVGQQLAKRLTLPFIDLDEWIEQQQQRPIREIFAEHGEAAFRQLEQQALHETVHLENAIISTGGGTPCFFDNMSWMNQHGVTIYLEVPVPILVQRLLPQRAKRPLIKDLEASELADFIHQKLAERVPFYEQAQVIYHVSSARENVADALYQQFSNIIGH